MGGNGADLAAFIEDLMLTSFSAHKAVISSRVPYIILPVSSCRFYAGGQEAELQPPVSRVFHLGTIMGWHGHHQGHRGQISTSDPVWSSHR